MSCNIVNEYISFSKKTMKKYLELILEHYFDRDIYDELINAYINTRYYNLYEKVDNHFETNIVHYLKLSLVDIKDDSKYHKKAKYMFSMFKYILYFDNVRECPSVKNLIKEIDEFRKKELNIDEEDFVTKFYDELKGDLLAKEEFIKKFEDKNFTVNYVKINRHQIYDCALEQNLKISKFYSEYALDKIFNNKEIKEQKLFVLYPLVTVKILQDIIKGNFKKNYLVDYPITLKDKPKKQKRILNIIDNDIVKEKISLKINYSEYKESKEEVYKLTRNGFKIALILDENINEEMRILFKIFSYIITNNQDIYEKLKDDNKVLYIPN